jgi:hypothetical protein
VPISNLWINLNFCLELLDSLFLKLRYKSHIISPKTININSLFVQRIYYFFSNLMKCELLEDRHYSPSPPPKSKFTLDTVWYIDILMTGHNEICGTNPVISFLFWRRRHRHLTNASKCTSTHTYTHTNDLVTVLYKPTLSHQDDALLWQEFHCTPKIRQQWIIIYILILSLLLFI